MRNNIVNQNWERTMQPQIFANKLVKLLPQLMKEISRHENNYISNGKMTCQQFITLETISRKDDWCMNELVESLDSSFSTITGMVDRLVNLELASRHRGDADRRKVYVSITQKGRKIVNEVLSQKREGIEQVFKRLTPEERQLYLEIIEKLSTSLASTKGEVLC